MERKSFVTWRSFIIYSLKLGLQVLILWDSSPPSNSSNIRGNVFHYFFKIEKGEREKVRKMECAYWDIKVINKMDGSVYKLHKFVLQDLEKFGEFFTNNPQTSELVIDEDAKAFESLIEKLYEKHEIDIEFQIDSLKELLLLKKLDQESYEASHQNYFESLMTKLKVTWNEKELESYLLSNTIPTFWNDNFSDHHVKQVLLLNKVHNVRGNIYYKNSLTMAKVSLMEEEYNVSIVNIAKKNWEEVNFDIEKLGNKLEYLELYLSFVNFDMFQNVKVTVTLPERYREAYPCIAWAKNH